MLSAAFGDWIRTLHEREFDETFLALLRASGFSDVHFTHGNYEYGKDVIAKRSDPPTQYAFQCKAGDIGGPEWDSLFAQLFQLTSHKLVHPNFDPSLPCQFVLTTTGRLKGKAPLAAKDFGERLASQAGQGFQVWEETTLREMLEGRGYTSIPPGPGLLPILGRIHSGTLEEHDLDRLLAALVPPPQASGKELLRAILDNAIVTACMAQAGLALHALTASLNEIRILATRAHAHPEDVALIPEAMAKYNRLGWSALAPVLTHPDDTRVWLEWCGGTMGKILAYPAACLRVIEFLGLSALACPEDSGRCVDALSQVVATQPGVSRPISDRYAASLAPAVIALARHGRASEAESLLVRATRWVCDRYEASAFGLASSEATPREEAEVLLGSAFDFIHLQERRESLLAVVLADLAHACAPAVYPDIVNDLLAVRIIPTAVSPQDSPLGYRVGTGAVSPLVNVVYPDEPMASSLPHHNSLGPRHIEALGHGYALLAIACLTRDRLFVDCYPRLALASS